MWYHWCLRRTENQCYLVTRSLSVLQAHIPSTALCQQSKAVSIAFSPSWASAYLTQHWKKSDFQSSGIYAFVYWESKISQETEWSGEVEGKLWESSLHPSSSISWHLTPYKITWVNNKIPLNIPLLKTWVLINQVNLFWRELLNEYNWHLPDLHTLVLNCGQEFPIAFTGRKRNKSLYEYL